MKSKQEWYLPKDLAGIGGLSPFPSNVTRKAKQENWIKREAKGIKGGGFEYHYSSLPSAVQQQLGFDVIDKESQLIQKGDNFSYIDELSIKDSAVISQKFAFRTDWLRKLAINISNSTFMKMPDESMESTIYKGDRALVTIFYYKEGGKLKRGLETQEQLWQLKDGLYVVQINSRLTIRRLQFDFHKGLYISCDNPLYQTVHLTQEQIDPKIIIGQVRWYAHTVQWD